VPQFADKNPLIDLRELSRNFEVALEAPAQDYKNRKGEDSDDIKTIMAMIIVILHRRVQVKTIEFPAIAKQLYEVEHSRFSDLLDSLERNLMVEKSKVNGAVTWSLSAESLRQLN